MSTEPHDANRNEDPDFVPKVVIPAAYQEDYRMFLAWREKHVTPTGPILKAHVEAIEAAAFALWDNGQGRASYPNSKIGWQTTTEEVRDHWRQMARVCVSAYQAVRRDAT